MRSCARAGARMGSACTKARRSIARGRVVGAKKVRAIASRISCSRFTGLLSPSPRGGGGGGGHENGRAKPPGGRGFPPPPPPPAPPGGEGDGVDFRRPADALADP